MSLSSVSGHQPNLSSNIVIDVRILACILKAVGGVIVIDIHDLAAIDSTPNIICWQSADGSKITYTLTETPVTLK